MGTAHLMGQLGLSSNPEVALPPSTCRDSSDRGGSPAGIRFWPPTPRGVLSCYFTSTLRPSARSSRKFARQ
ncbi:hypothetical protein BGW80DRAFT_812752 [Lactifluus volemus]|nr:hypothetical protein BGW80DRAFT_812752 [Lactifluus volemus]